MTPIKIKLRDSISITAINTDKFKTGVLSLSLCLPMTRQSCAHNTILSGVIRRGTQKYPSCALLNKALDELYAATVEIKNSRCGRNCLLTLSAELLDNAFVADKTDVLDGVAAILAEMLLHPVTEDGAFPRETVKKEIEHVKDAIRAEKNDPRAYSADRCGELLHRNDKSFPTLEELFEDVSTADEKSLYEYYKKLISSSELNIYYVGSESAERVGNIINKHFSEFSGSYLPPSPISPEAFGGFVERTEPMAVSQGKLCIGLRVGVCVGEERYFAAVMFNEIFGGSPASKLFMNVREKMSLCYYCSSRYDTYMGNITISAGINVSDRELAYSAILSQLEDIRDGKISDVELTAAKKAIAHVYRQIYDYPLDLIGFYRNKAIFGIEASTEDYAKKFEAVTREDIVQIAKEIKLDSVFFLEGTLDDGSEWEECDE